MTDHGPLCTSYWCNCDLIANVRADEREGTVPLSDWEEAVLALGAAKVELADLRARVEALPTWDGYHAPVVVLADVLALLGGDDD